MEQPLRVLVNHQQDDWVKRLLVAECAANNGTSETTKCTPFFAVQGVDRQMSFIGEPMKDRDLPRINADQVQAIMQQVPEHLQVKMRRSQAILEEGANHARISAQDIPKGSQLWFDTRHFRTTRPTLKLDWKQLGPVTVVHWVSPYAYELELPASIQIHRVQRISQLDPVVVDPLDGQRINPPPSVDVEGEEEYQVSSVEDSRMYRA